MPTLNVLQPSRPRPRGRAPKPCWDRTGLPNPAVPHSVTSAPLHPLTTCTQHRGVLLGNCLLCLDYPTSSRQSKDDCNKSQFPSCSQGAALPKSSPAPHHACAATVTTPPRFSPATFIFHSAPPLRLTANINPAQGSSSICAGTATTSPSEDNTSRAFISPKLRCSQLWLRWISPHTLPCPSVSVDLLSVDAAGCLQHG